jgi:hypothetical protein
MPLTHLPSSPVPSCCVTLKMRGTGRWSFTADDYTMRVVAAMLLNSSLSPRDHAHPWARAAAKRTLRAFGRAGLF